MRVLLGLTVLFSMAAYARIPVEPHVAWSKDSVKVCWGDESHQTYSLIANDPYDFVEYTNSQKNSIKEIITKEYNLKEVGIQFTGWEKCDEKATNGDIILFRIEPAIPDVEGPFMEKGGRATIGEKGQTVTYIDINHITTQSYEKEKTPLKGFMLLNTRAASEKIIGTANYIQLLALHEFGHSAGLRHQHVRMKEALEDSNCKRQNNLKLVNEEVFASTIFTGVYDFNSVMNYCFINTMISDTGLEFRAKNLDDVIKLTDTSLYTTKEVKNIFGQKRLKIDLRVGLSSLDRHALKCLYVFDSETKKNLCNFPK